MLLTLSTLIARTSSLLSSSRQLSTLPTRRSFHFSHSQQINTSTTAMSSIKQVVSVDPFCHKQFPEMSETTGKPGNLIGTTIAEVEEKCNRFIADNGGEEGCLKNGYAPFCKHVFLPNDFTDARVNVLKADGNESIIRTKYEARSDKELPVLIRYIPKSLLGDVDLPRAEWLDVILYSRKQIDIETVAMNAEKDTNTTPWGIISIKPQTHPHELPMNPITAMRNALGAEYGGSGREVSSCVRDLATFVIFCWSPNPLFFNNN